MKTMRIMSAIFYLASIFFHPAQADSTAQFHGTLTQASCTFEAADVDLGNITFKEASNLATRNFTLNMTCKGSATNPVYVQAFGDAVDCNFFDKCFATNLDGLTTYIAIEIDGEYESLFPNGMNEEAELVPKSALNFMAYVIADKKKIYTGGDFSSTITLRVTMS